MTTPKVREGYVNVPGGKVWYQIVGSGDAIPLLTLHGGPGCPHDELEPLQGLADERPIVFYDQLGCGKSDRPDDVSLWHVERFVEELGRLREALGLQRVHILGHSWGSMLATDYTLTQPAGLVSLILASPILSVPRLRKDTTELLSQLPAEVQEVLSRHEAAGTMDSEEYQGAMMEFTKRYMCRLDPMPESLMRSIQGIGVQVILTMWGPASWLITGNLKDYDRSDRLHEIRVPTLFTCGRYDYATPEATAWYQSLLLGSEMAVFEDSSHTQPLEEAEPYLATVRDFLRRVERK